MQLGYLTQEGHLVNVDTFGTASLYKAYRIDAAAKRLEFLGVPRPTEALGEVAVTVELHRWGWGAPGEVVLKRTAGTLLRTRTSHLVVGGTWKAIVAFVRALRWGYGAAGAWIARPLLSNLPPVPHPKGTVRLKGTFPPARTAPAVVQFHDGSVRAVRREGSRVRVFATEEKEFTSFIVGKLEAVLEFPTEAAAEAFAREFPRIEDPARLDPSVKVEVDRSRKRNWTKGQRLGLAAFAVIMVVIIFGVLYALAPYLRDNPGLRSGVQGGLTVGLVVVALTILSAARAARRETVDLREKWPRKMFERWCSEAPGRAGAMLPVLKELGAEIDPAKGSLEPLDRLLRGLPADTFFGSMALDLASLVGGFLLGDIARPMEFEWRLPGEREGPRHPVLSFGGIDLWVSPLHAVGSVWERKGAETLDEFVRSTAKSVQMHAAFGQLIEAVALGFVPNGWEDFEGLAARLEKDLEGVPAESHVLGEDHYRARRARYGEFEVTFVEIELTTPTGPRFAPMLAILSSDAARVVHGQLEGGPRGKDAREDLAVVRLEGAELVPLGVQVRNYLEVGPAVTERAGRLSIRLRAVADKAQVASPRLRESRPEAKDFLAPMHPTPEGVPQSPYGNFLGRIASVGELENPVGKMPLWRLGLDILGFPLELVVRKDRCEGTPQVGHFLAGSVWLLGDFEAAKAAPSTYIR